MNRPQFSKAFILAVVTLLCANCERELLTSPPKSYEPPEAKVSEVKGLVSDQALLNSLSFGLSFPKEVQQEPAGIMSFEIGTSLVPREPHMQWPNGRYASKDMLMEKEELSQLAEEISRQLSEREIISSYSRSVPEPQGNPPCELTTSEFLSQENNGLVIRASHHFEKEYHYCKWLVISLDDLTDQLFLTLKNCSENQEYQQLLEELATFARENKIPPHEAKALQIARAFLAERDFPHEEKLTTFEQVELEGEQVLQLIFTDPDPLMRGGAASFWFAYDAETKSISREFIKMEFWR